MKGTAKTKMQHSTGCVPDWAQLLLLSLQGLPSLCLSSVWVHPPDAFQSKRKNTPVFCSTGNIQEGTCLENTEITSIDQLEGLKEELKLWQEDQKQAPKNIQETEEEIISFRDTNRKQKKKNRWERYTLVYQVVLFSHEKKKQCQDNQCTCPEISVFSPGPD